MPLTDYTNCSYFNIRKSLRFVQTVSVQVYKRTLRFVETVKVIDITVCRNRRSICIFLLFTASTNRRTFFCLRFVEVVRSEKNANASTVSTNRRTFFFLFSGLYKPQNSSKFFFFCGLYKPQNSTKKFFFCSLYKPQNRKFFSTVLRFVQTAEEKI